VEREGELASETKVGVGKGKEGETNKVRKKLERKRGH
jgi:hypothetical protein